MESQTKPSALARALEREHAAVERAVSSLRGEMSALHEHISVPASLGRLPALLLRFRLHLGRHFGLEEQGGFFARLARIEATRQSVEGLLMDHARMDAQCARLVRAAQCAALGQGEIGRTFFADVEALLSVLEQHEQLERRLQELLVSESRRAD